MAGIAQRSLIRQRIGCRCQNRREIEYAPLGNDMTKLADESDFDHYFNACCRQSRHIERMQEALRMIADIAEGSQTVNSLPHIAKIARSTLPAAL